MSSSFVEDRTPEEVRSSEIRSQIEDLLVELAGLQDPRCVKAMPTTIKGGHYGMVGTPIQQGEVPFEITIEEPQIMLYSESREVADIDYHDPEKGHMVRELIPGPVTAWFAVMG